MNTAARTLQEENKRNKRRSLMLSYILFAASFVIVFFLVFMRVTAGVHFLVTVDGENIGYISDVSSFESVRSRVETAMSEILGFSYKFGAKTQFKLSYGESRNVIGENELYDRLYDISAKDLTQAYALYIDKRMVAANPDMDVIKTALSKAVSIIEQKYGCTVEIANDVFYALRPVPSEYVLSVNEITDLICDASVIPQGTTVDAVLEASSVNASAIYEKRAEAEKKFCDFTNMYYTEVSEGDEGKLSIKYKTTVTEEYNEVIPFKTVYEDSDFYYEGMTYVKRAGVTGERKVVALASYVNGEEVDRVVLSTETLSEPTDKIVLVGTKPKPPTAPTGVFILPSMSTTVTSGFGWRTIFGGNGFHYGLDFDAKTGTTVYASDGGTVITARYSGAYGLCVKIDHGGKYETIYAHLSEILVSEGDEVYQGQPIGLSGATGRVTGPHVHFEILEFGERKNPAQFLRNITPDCVINLSAKEMEELRLTAEAFIK